MSDNATSITSVPAARDFPFWCVADRWNERDRHATWKSQEKAKPVKHKVEQVDDER